MITDLIDNPTRRAIILALKKKGCLSVDDLSKEVKITPMGVRQHLFILERNGIVDYITRKQGIGRPGFLYKLTEAADELFPKSYAEFALDVLEGLKETDGIEKIADLLDRRNDRIRSSKLKMFAGKNSLPARLSALVEMIREEGGIAELEEGDSHYKLKQFNCPLTKISSQFKELCTYDHKLYEELAGVPMTTTERIADGGHACVYVIPKDAQ